MAKFSWTAAMAVCLCLVQNVAGHMEMSMPYPINSQLNSAVPSNLKDYSYTSPLDSSGANFPCKGYQNDRPALITATYTAGQTSKMTFSGSATHGGGSCQISLSYDNGKTFRVIKSMIGGCPLPKEYDFTIPSYAPAGNALLAWTWYNLIGNREIYMDCAQVTIHNASSSPARRRSVQQRRDSSKFTSFEQLPYIWKANLPGTTDCATVEGVNPVFPNPGPDVVYGDGESASSPPTSGSCENPSPPGQAYKDIAVPGGSGPANSGSSSSSSGSSGGSSDSSSSSGSGSGSGSGGQVTPIATPSASNPGPSPSPSSSSSSAAVGGGQGSSSVAPVNQQTPVTTITLPSPSTTPSLNGGAGSGSSGSTGSSGSGNLAFVSNPPAKSFYPCTPGTFLCTSSTSFLQCASADWYVDMGSVAAGTQCQPQAGPDGARADHIVG